MTSNHKLILVKTIHTLIWIAFNLVFSFMVYSVVVNKIDKFVWIGLALFSLEILLLAVLKNHCPLTIIARRYSDSEKENFDIYLPNWLAKHNKLIYSVFLALFLMFLMYRMGTN